MARQSISASSSASGISPCVVHGDVPHARLGGLEDPERADVGRALGEDDVAGVDEDAGDQVQALLRADGDDDLAGRGVGDALQGHDVADPLAQPRVALTGAVLQRLGAHAGDQLADHRADGVERQGGDRGHAAGQRDHLGPADDGEQRPDLRGLHPVRACCVPVRQRVQPRMPRDDVGMRTVRQVRPRLTGTGGRAGRSVAPSRV